MVKVKDDLTGKVFGRLTVLEQVEDYVSPKGIHIARWLCECLCQEHNKTIVSGHSLRNGATQSCGCLQKERTSDANFVDMTGWIMKEHGFKNSRLTVIKRTDDYINDKGIHTTQWLCKCDCGNDDVVVSAPHLKSGHTLSCGCLQQERVSETMKKYNKYDLSGEYGIGWTSNTNKEFYFDLDDYDKIQKYCWSETSRSNDNYHRLEARDSDLNKNIAMHYLIQGKYCDHVDRNPLNNRKSNLRPATVEQNAKNISLYKNNKSGVIGVGLSKRDGRWRANIQVDNKQLHLGYFKDKDDAIRARLNAEVKYYGEFAPQRHLYEQYGIEELESISV